MSHGRSTQLAELNRLALSNVKGGGPTIDGQTDARTRGKPDLARSTSHPHHGSQIRHNWRRLRRQKKSQLFQLTISDFEYCKN